MRVAPPRELADLPYAHHLEPCAGEPERDGAHDCVHVDGAHYEDLDGGRLRLVESALSEVTLTGGRYRRARLDSVWCRGLRAVGTDLAETAWLDVDCAAGLFAGIQLHGAELRRVVFRNCKFDSVNFRAARLREVAFVDCLLRDADFAGAALNDVVFPGSTLESVRLDGAGLAKTDLREARALGITSGFEALRGAVISTPQLFDLAPSLAAHLGLTVKDD
ncbi:pentapeptide repeat-containing protein [Streptomyces sp. NPDC097619]|uniref:pentapeptide repeat-containing protein n=1 Tax=Streptomyces sp. NPDC097619 TaxID=3157228 RepID=UPI0033215BA3